MRTIIVVFTDRKVCNTCFCASVPANEVPHITIATFRGGNPVDSNRIINWRCIEPVIITAKLEKR